jgi:hypothetical protein
VIVKVKERYEVSVFRFSPCYLVDGY